MVFTTQNTMGGLGEAIQGLGGSLGQVLKQRGERAQQQQYGTILEEELAKLDSNPTQVDFMNAINSSVGRGVPLETGLKYAQIFKPEKIGATNTEKIHNLKVGQSTLGKMEKLVEKGNVGTTFGVNLNPFARVGEIGEDRAQFQTLGKSLIPLVAAGVSIRNQREFDEYKKIITDSSASLANIKGAIAGLKQLIGTQLQDYSGEEITISSVEESPSSEPGNVEASKVVEMATMPPPGQHKGKTLKDTSSGKRYKSDGNRWKEVK